MNPFERRVIHSTLTSSTTVKTESEGLEPQRYVAIIPNGWKIEDGEIKERPFGSDKKSSRDHGRRDFKGRNDKREKSSFKSEMIKTSKKTAGFGTFLGNSLKG